MKKLISAIEDMNTGAPVWLPDLREKVSMGKEEFDQAILNLARTGGRYFLNRHCYPAPCSPQEIEGFIPDGEMNYYIALGIRPEVPVKMPASDVKEIQNPGKGGKRPGAGRPMLKKRFRKEQIAARLPGWIVEWLHGQEGKPADLIEKALIAQYGLVPPEP